MKIKILKSSGWYKGYIETEFEVDGYHLTSSADLRFSVFNHGWIYSCDCVITELPESFCVKSCDDGIKWGKYIQWLNKNYNTDFCGRIFNSDRPYYGVINDEGWGIKIPFGTEIHIDDMIKHIDYMESQQHIKGGEQFSKESQLTVNMGTQKLSRQGLKEIHSVACPNWKDVLEHYGSRNPLEDYVELTQGEVDKMFDACTKDQLPIVSKYLKQDDGSINFDNLLGDGYKLNERQLIGKRVFGVFSYKSFYLDNKFNWEIRKDEYGELCLIPTKNK